MKLNVHLPRIGHKTSALGIIVLLSCFVAYGAVDAVASATTTKSLTQEQKLSKALKVCKKQPKPKRAACAKRANKRYATHHGATAPGGSTPSAGPVTKPSVPVTSPVGPVAPAAPTFAAIEALACSFYCPMVNFNILERGVPRLGTGLDTTRGGDGVPSDTWIFPLLLSYDKSYQAHGVGPAPTYVGYTYTVILHWREKTNAQLDAAGGLRIWQQAATETCEPAVVGCGSSTGGGA